MASYILGECCCGVTPPDCAGESCRSGWGVSDNKISVIGFQNSFAGGSGFPLIHWYGTDPCDWNDYFDFGQFGTETAGVPASVTPPLVGATSVNGVTVTVSGPAAEIRCIGSTYTGNLGPGVSDSIPSELAAGSGTGLGKGDEALVVLSSTVTFTLEFSDGHVYAAAVAMGVGALGKSSVTVEAWDSGGNNTSTTFDHDTSSYDGSWQNGSAQIFPAQGETISKIEISGGAAGAFVIGHLALCTAAD